MRFAKINLTLLHVAAVFAQGRNFTVLVGLNGARTFTPTSYSDVKPSDTIIFQFVSGNHTATQSTFDSPCQQMQTPKVGITSGFQSISDGSMTNTQWSFTLDDAAPLWFFCAQKGHCAAGMVFAVNPTANSTFAAFQAAASGSASGSTVGASGATVAGSPVSASTSVATTSATSAITASSTKSAQNGGFRLSAGLPIVLALTGTIGAIL